MWYCQMVKIAEEYKVFHNQVWKMASGKTVWIRDYVQVLMFIAQCRFQIWSYGHGSVLIKGLELTVSARCAYLPACDPSSLFRGLLQASLELIERLLCMGYCTDNRGRGVRNQSDWTSHPISAVSSCSIYFQGQIGWGLEGGRCPCPCEGLKIDYL